ncbi:Uncharacterized protein Fot_23574 [Forsythia ovata]|uniref:Uncharacterized protein n=1 Tax=Forsythia ovata TaxID=205694 RepID=A0ABD1V2W6_9LAMI
MSHYMKGIFVKSPNILFLPNLTQCPTLTKRKRIKKKEELVQAPQQDSVAMENEALVKLESLKSLNQRLLKEAMERRKEVESLMRSKGSLESDVTRTEKNGHNHDRLFPLPYRPLDQKFGTHLQFSKVKSSRIFGKPRGCGPAQPLEGLQQVQKKQNQDEENDGFSFLQRNSELAMGWICKRKWVEFGKNSIFGELTKMTFIE